MGVFALLFMLIAVATKSQGLASFFRKFSDKPKTVLKVNTDFVMLHTTSMQRKLENI